jgi:L-aminopeptidase/D-esterase-like protein
MRAQVWLVAAVVFSFVVCAEAQRARDLGIPFDGTPGPLNAITDVPGVEVGQKTLISGEGKSAVRTGVTAIFPRGKISQDPTFAGWFTENGNGEMTGTTWVEESGFLEGPVLITNTHSVGVVRDAVIEWRVKHGFSGEYPWSLPVVAETYDGYLNDINGFHVTKQDAFDAMNAARSGSVEEGNVGGGTGMICNGFKGGIGTSSRRVEELKSGSYTVGVLVQCNYGTRDVLRVAGIPLGREIKEKSILGAANRSEREDVGSIIVVVATDAPLIGQQMKRIARRVTLGLGRDGSISGNGSGDIFIAFSTANPHAARAEAIPQVGAGEISRVQMLANDALDPLFKATVEATEEAVINALVAARDMTGYDSHRVLALPHDELQAILKKYNRIAEKK